MGVWESYRGHVSDEIADILDNALEAIEKCYYGIGKKKFIILDLADALEFVTRGILKVEINPEAEELKNIEIGQLFDKDTIKITFNNNGQIKGMTLKY